MPETWGGNVEILPPNGKNKFGLIISGSTINNDDQNGLAEFLKRQQVQSKNGAGILSCNISPLGVSHIDELIFIAEDKIFIANPILAIDILKSGFTLGNTTYQGYTEEEIKNFLGEDLYATYINIVNFWEYTKTPEQRTKIKIIEGIKKQIEEQGYEVIYLPTLISLARGEEFTNAANSQYIKKGNVKLILSVKQYLDLLDTYNRELVFKKYIPGVTVKEIDVSEILGYDGQVHCATQAARKPFDF